MNNAMLAGTLIPVSFHEDLVELVAFEGRPYVAMRQIVTNMGLNWPAQYAKLTAKFGPTVVMNTTVDAEIDVKSASTVAMTATVEPEKAPKTMANLVEIVTVGADGKQRSMVCLAFHKLAAWLNSISPNKLAPRLRAKVVMYQAECDDALWDYWTKGVAVNPRMAANTLSVHESIALSKECARLLKDIADCTNAVLAGELFKHLQRMTAALGETVAPLQQLALGLRQKPLPLPQGGAA